MSLSPEEEVEACLHALRYEGNEAEPLRMSHDAGVLPHIIARPASLVDGQVRLQAALGIKPFGVGR